MCRSNVELGSDPDLAPRWSLLPREASSGWWGFLLGGRWWWWIIVAGGGGGAENMLLSGVLTECRWCAGVRAVSALETLAALPLRRASRLARRAAQMRA